VSGDNGDDLVTGNFGSDTLSGGNGDDGLNGDVFDPVTFEPAADPNPSTDSCNGGKGDNFFFGCEVAS
jgi:Ca2+-binding RTX toxin-like protein